MNTAKKIPVRQCMGCNEHKPKAELLRVVRTTEGNIELDFNGRMNGRGAYICKNIACLRAARKTNRLARMLECTIPSEVYDEMEAKLVNSNE